MQSSKLSERVQVLFQGLSVSTKDTLLYQSDAATAVHWINIRNFHRVMCIVFRVKGTGSIQQCQLMAATDVAGTGAVAIESSGSTEATGLVTAAQPSNDNVQVGTGARGAGMIVFDLNTNDIEATLADATHVTCRLSQATGADRMSICWILADPRYPTAAMTGTGRGTTAPAGFQ